MSDSARQTETDRDPRGVIGGVPVEKFDSDDVQMAWIPQRHSHGKNRFHTRRDCHYVQHMENAKRKPREYVEKTMGYDHCENCQQLDAGEDA